MAAIAKYTPARVACELGHGARTNNTSAEHIDKSRTCNNTILSRVREVTPYQYYKQRLSELKKMNRDDVKTLVEVVVTLPADCPPGEEDLFFDSVYFFLQDKFCKDLRDEVLATIHRDETAGQDHLHFYFIPNEEGRVSSHNLLSRQVLRNFHDDMQAYLDKSAKDMLLDTLGTVKNGRTKAQGGNRTVHQLKEQTRAEREQTRTVDAWGREVERSDNIWSF